MKYKKIFALILSAVMLLSLAACGGDDAPQEEPKNKTQVAQTQPAGGGGQEPIRGKAQPVRGDAADPAGGNAVPAQEPASTGRQLPTAESLVANGTLKDVNSLDAMLALAYQISTDASDMLSEDTGGDMRMTVGVRMDMDLQTQEKPTEGTSYQHLNGDVAINMFGMDYSDKMETYMISQEDGPVTSYDWDSGSDSWTVKTMGVEESEEGDMSGFYAMTNLGTDVFSDLELLPYTEGESTYTVTGKISLENLCRGTGMEPQDLFSGVVDSSSEIPMNMAYDVVLTYNADTEQLMGMYLSLDTNLVPAMGEVDIEEFTLNFTIVSVNDVVVEIPQEIIANAEEEPDDFESFEDTFGGLDSSDFVG